VWRRGRKRSYVSVDRVVIALDEREPTDVDAAAAAYDKLLGVAAANATPRPVAWLGLLGRAIGMLLSRRLGRRARPPLSERQRPATGA
jgi:hypothetical protein